MAIFSDHRLSRVIAVVGLVLLAITFSVPTDSSPLLTQIEIAVASIIVGAALSGAWMARSIARQLSGLLNEDSQLMDPSLRLHMKGSSDLSYIVNRVRRTFEYLEKKLSLSQAELHGAQDRYQLLTDNLAASVIIRDIEGKIAFCSPYTEVLTGYSLREIYASESDFFLSILHPSDAEKYHRAFKIAATGEAFQFRYRIHHRTGIEMWVETRTVPIVGEDGEVSLSLSVTLDVTGAVRYQRQVEEKNRDLHDFTYMVSHDLKAPIFTIKGMAAVLREDLAATLTPDTTEALDHIAGASRRLETLVASVLEYSRISSQEMAHESVPLAEVFKEIRADFSSLIQSAHATVTVDPHLPWVMGDRLRLYQIFGNLIGNAIKFRSPERPCRVQVRLEPSRHERAVTITVADNGLGIPADKREDIFRPFHRLHGHHIEGSGIGLACVRKLLERCGGSIAVESSEGQGSIFRVTVERADTPRHSPGEPQSELPSP